MKQWILGKNRPGDKSLFIWNTIGSSIYAASSMILTYLTIRIVGTEEGGIFAIGLTLAQMFVYIAYYETRSFQVTDAENRYCFEDYHVTKILCCIMMLIVSFVYVLLKGYDIHKLLVVMLVCIYRMLDGYADAFESQFHKSERLDLAGKSMAFRTIISVTVYFLALIITGELVASLVIAIVFGMLGVYVFNIWIFHGFGTMKLKTNRKQLLGILKECFPLFVGMFLWTYLLSASRIAVDNVMTSSDQSYYQVLFLPVSVVNLFAGFLIRPSLLVLTEHHAKGNKKEFWGIVLKILFVMMFILICCMIGAYIIGIPVLELLAGCDLSIYRILFVFLIFAGGFNSVAYILYYVLTIYRNQVAIVMGYGIAAVIALFISNPLTQMYGLWGAAVSYFVSVVVLAIIFVAWLIRLSNIDKKN